MERKNYLKGQAIAYENDLCTGVFIVEKGSVEIASYALSGNKIVYNLLSEGEMFGNHLVFSSDPFYRGNVSAKEDCVLLYINKDRLLRVLQEKEDLLLTFLRLQSDFGKSLNAKMKILSFETAEERLLFYLQTHQKTVRMKSISSFADELFLQRETLSRLIHRLEQEGRLRIDGKQIILL